jgi:exopolysaccharide biosynthesis polyprenyl glycosylphosphotransferase
MAYRTVQRKLLEAGVGHRRTLIVGWGRRGRKLAEELASYPALGHKVIGFVSQEPEDGHETSYKELPLLGDISEIDRVVFESKTQDVIFALAGDSRKKVMHVVNQCNGLAVNFKVVPDLYDIVVGQTRTNQIYGLPLIDIMPDFMPVWERRMKRLGDVVISGLILTAFAPFWLVVVAAIKLNSKGPVVYRQTRIGKDCKHFTMFKFRSMYEDAESQSGPRWATQNDPRITPVGRFLRATRIDEIPQFFNVLKGEMSLIGPRPERPYFVEQFQTTIPFYLRRFRVRPGITGWAQIKSGYDIDIDNVKNKLQYDLFYLENMSLRMDLKIMLSTLYVMIRGKGQ